MLESPLEGIFKLRLDWTIAYANRQALLLGTELVLEKSYWECYPATRGTILEDSFVRTMRDRVMTEFEILGDRSGQWFHVHCFPAEEGGMSVFFTPLTARKQLEEELFTELLLRKEHEDAVIRTNESLNHILDSTSEGIMKIDPQWTILYANRQAREIAPKIKVGTNFWTEYPELAGTPVEDHLRSCMKEGVEVRYETYYPPYDQWFDVKAFPTPRGISLFYRVTTAEKKLAEQLAAERALHERRIQILSHMAGGLAQELCDPLAIIHTTACDLKRKAHDQPALSPSDVLQAADLLVQISERAVQILRGLQGFPQDSKTIRSSTPP